MGNSWLSTRTSAQILPDLACHSHVSPPKKAYPLWKPFGSHLLRLVPGLAVVGGTPDEIRPAAAVIIHTQEQRAIRQAQNVAGTGVVRFRLDALRLDTERLPRLAAIGGAVQEAAGVAPLVPHVLSEQVHRDEDRAVGQHGEVRLAAEQIRLLRRRPGLAAIARPEEQHLLQHFAAGLFVRLKRGEQQFAVGHPGNAGLVVVRFAERDAFARDGVRRQVQRVPDRRSVGMICRDKRRTCGDRRAEQKSRDANPAARD